MIKYLSRLVVHREFYYFVSSKLCDLLRVTVLCSISLLPAQQHFTTQLPLKMIKPFRGRYRKCSQNHSLHYARNWIWFLPQVGPRAVHSFMRKRFCLWCLEKLENVWTLKFHHWKEVEYLVKSLRKNECRDGWKMQKGVRDGFFFFFSFCSL